MRLYIDESGNTGSTNIKNLKSNFADQPYYSLAGILLSNNQENELNKFIEPLLKKYSIQANELKAKNLYENKPNLIIEIINYLSQREIPCFIELMEKKFYMNTQVLDAFFIPANSMPISDELMLYKNFIASILSRYMTPEIYEKFCFACKTYTSEEFENFIQFIKTELSKKPIDEIKQFLLKMVEMTEIDYFELKSEQHEDAYKSFLPLPDKKHNDEYIFMLPNYHAFSNLIGRTNLYVKRKNLIKFDITHDEQKHFDIIYQDIIQRLKETDINSVGNGTVINQRTDFKIDENLTLNFDKSENNKSLQVADLLSGFVMRYLKDFENNNESQINKYKKTIIQLFAVTPPAGANLVLTNQDYSKLMNFLYD